MKIFKKKAELVAIHKHQEDTFYDYRCPDCGYGVADDYICCPHCTRKLVFEKPEQAAARELKEAVEEEAIKLGYKDRLDGR